MSQAQPTVEDGKVVLFHYTLTNDAGEVLDSSRGGSGPLPYLHGAHNIVPGLEKQLGGLAVGATLQAVVPPEEGYGPAQPPMPPVPLAELPPEIEAGMQLLAEMPDGRRVPIFVLEVRAEDAVLTQAHPLAGVTLHFDVEISGIRDATAEEMQHGHPHGPDGTGGHHHDHGH